MTSKKIKLFCILDGDSSAFEVKLDADDSIAALKEAIKEKKKPRLDDIAADELTLWHVSISIDDDDEEKPIALEDQINAKKLRATSDISEVFGTAPAKKTIHVIVQRPLAEDLETTIKKITASFFANDSQAAVFLNKYVKGEMELSVTTDGILSLPRAWRRGKTSEPTQESRPNFLFLDLPAAPSDNTIPDQFSSNVILSALENTEARDVPVFGGVF
ncbi:hypothetical protein BGX27_003718 [Mortierella sp. AM989]|nr:hypothetical protein BGX27_003718 [Mortierella sp. AM989]